MFLFPRTPADVAGFEHELRVYERLDLPIVARLAGRWHDERVYPFPFAAVTRLPGVHVDDPAPLLEQLGRAIAGWHRLDASDLRDLDQPPPAHHAEPANAWLRRALTTRASRQAVDELCDRVGEQRRRNHWVGLLGQAAGLDHVLVHGDVHEDQLLVDDGRLTGVVDWETARIDHPFWDFDFGEWGTGLWRRHRRDFDHLWTAMWRGYAGDDDADPRPLITAFRLRQVHYLLDEPDNHDPAISGTVEEHLAAL